MRRRLVGALLFSTFMPVAAFAQVQPTCEQRLAVMGQIVEDLSRARAIVSTAEIEAASLKVQVKDLQQQLQASTEKKDTKETKEKK
jgi:predicted  nucleic acid-binding Zn-ribbon protein